MKSLPRYPSIVFAFAGDSTISKFFAIDFFWISANLDKFVLSAINCPECSANIRACGVSYAGNHGLKKHVEQKKTGKSHRRHAVGRHERPVYPAQVSRTNHTVLVNK